MRITTWEILDREALDERRNRPRIPLVTECRSCGRVADIEGAPAPQLAEAPGPPGWRLEEERVEFIGLCPECSADQDDQINQEG